MKKLIFREIENIIFSLEYESSVVTQNEVTVIKNSCVALGIVNSPVTGNYIKCLRFRPFFEPLKNRMEVLGGVSFRFKEVFVVIPDYTAGFDIDGEPLFNLGVSEFNIDGKKFVLQDTSQHKEGI